MKKLLLLIFLIPFFATAQHELEITKMFEESRSYKTHFINDGGTMTSTHADRYLKSLYFQSIDDEMMSSVLFYYLGTAATSLRPEAPLNYVEKVYDISTSGNDATQTTSTLQLYETGNIAPNENKGILNPNGDSRYITHPEISFSTTDEWSVTTCFAMEGTDSEYFAGKGSGTNNILGYYSGYIIRMKTNSGGNYVSSANIKHKIGKNTVLTFVVNQTASLYTLYLDGILFHSATITVAADFAFARIIEGLSGAARFTGKLNSHIIRNIALNSTQVSNEANLLLDIYPPIPYKTIETYNVATTSLDVVASSNGTAITMATDNTDWATGLARWRYYSDDSEIGSWGNKLYNKAARDVIIANPPDGYHVSSEAELTVIAAIDGNNLKVEGTDYWSTANGTNHSGFSSVGSGMVNTDGTFTGINTTVGFWCADSDKALIITDAGAATITSVSANEGYSIRLIQD